MMKTPAATLFGRTRRVLGLGISVFGLALVGRHVANFLA